MKRRTNFDQYLDEQLKDESFAERFKKAGEAWDIAVGLAALRKESGLSQRELAKRVGTTQQQISRLESPSYEGHSLSMLRRVAEAIGATIHIELLRRKQKQSIGIAESEPDYKSRLDKGGTNKNTGNRIIIIAGPNGAGKTTFAEEFLPNEADCPIFINADLIATGLSPFDPDRVEIKAGRLMLEEIFNHARRNDSFAFETTLSGRMYAKHIKSWQKQGYTIKLFFLCLNSPELAIARVHQRVREGGHNVPEQTIRRRFTAGLGHFEEIYKPIVDEWALYDNSSSTPILIDEGAK
ncbi:MAG: zeta toxin family protein [Syntrophales bacterium]|nr:zeta toxin family protein [Syntrophales bacterium]